MEASLTSLQFLALNSALAATDSTEKVQMMVSSLSIVHFCTDPSLFRYSAVSRLLAKLPPPAADSQVDYLMTGRVWWLKLNYSL